MFQAFYTGLSGLFSFSKNLDTVSNNIANMNTPGYRGQDTFYRSLSSGEGSSGLGTQVSGLGHRFAAGEVRQSTNANDMAISGNGFFVLRDGDQLRYTRAGQFEFNSDGVLVDKTTGFEVAEITSSGQVKSLDISSYKTIKPVATTEINFAGNLSSDATVHNVNGVTVYNGMGEAIEANFKFTNNNTVLAGSWLVEVTDKNGAVVGSSEIRFGTDTTPIAGFESMSFNISDSLGTVTSVSATFGTVGDITGSTSNANGATSTLDGTVKDGAPIGTLTAVTFGEDGLVKLTYNNGTVNDGPTLALANFSNDSVLELVEGTTFKSTDDSGRELGNPGEGTLGSLKTFSLELSNVDLSREFADMIVVQRGYQASSRILNVANQMLEQLYDSTRGR